MRRLTRAGSLALTLSAFAASGALAQGPKLAHLDSRAVLARTPAFVAIDSQVDLRTKSMQQRITVMQDSMETMIAAFQKEEPTLTPAVRQQRRDALAKKQGDYQREAASMQQRADSIREALSRPLIETFNRVLQDIRNEEGYAYVFDIGSPGQALLAVDKNLDITDKVLARLQTALAALGNPTKPPVAGPTAAPPTRPTTSPPPPRR
jgi:Skp family chaperone for outer membrane proteins